jgi:hypothetical protein
MTTLIVRVGNTLTVEIPEELASQAELAPGEPVEWVPNGSGSDLPLFSQPAIAGVSRCRFVGEYISPS